MTKESCMRCEFSLFCAHYSSDRAQLFLKDRFCEIVTNCGLHARQRTSANLRGGRFTCLFIYFMYVLFYYVSLHFVG